MRNGKIKIRKKSKRRKIIRKKINEKRSKVRNWKGKPGNEEKKEIFETGSDEELGR